MTESVHDRFWRQVDVNGECWEWKGRRRYDPYVSFGVEGKPVAGHRFAYEEVNGPIPEGLEIDHLCSNGGCVRPAHLEAVTHSENVRRGHARIKAGTVLPFYQRFTIRIS